MQKLIPLNKIRPNPMRELGKYPLIEEKVEELLSSIDETGFWDNLLARANNGSIELAYGHHRLAALRKKYRKTPGRKVPINFAKLSNEAMLKIMVEENRAEYGGGSTQDMMDVEVAVKAFARGDVTFPEVPKKARKSDCRVAPSFMKQPTPDDPPPQGITYTAVTLANAIGAAKKGGTEAKPWVHNALNGLAATESKLIKREWLEGLPRSNAEVIASGAGAIKKSYDQAAARLEKQGDSQAATKVKKDGEKAAKNAAEAASRDFKKGAGVREVRQNMSAAKAAAPKKKTPDVSKFTTALAKSLDTILSSKDKRWLKLNELIKYRMDLTDKQLNNAIVAIDSLMERCRVLKDALRGQNIKLLK